MMYLKKYQVDVVGKLKQFFSFAQEGIAKHQKAKANDPDLVFPWLEKTFSRLAIDLKDKPKTGLGDEYARIVLKIPTGGGKTLLAVEAIREYQNLFAQRKNGLIVWIVPSETIYSQTVQKLRDKSNHLRQLLDQCSGNRTLIIEKGQRLTQQDIQEHLVVLFVMIQSVSRITNRESLKVFQDSGGFEGFFPPDNRYDLHKEWLGKVPNLDKFSNTESAFPQIKTSLGNAIRVSNPFIIIDEIHRVFSPAARQTIDNLNPSMVLGLSATPDQKAMNILIRITGLQLKEEDMVKLDMHLIPPKNITMDGRICCGK